MSLLADKIKYKTKSQTSASKPGPQPRDISRIASLAGTCVGFRARRVVGFAGLMLVFATIYNIYGGFGGIFSENAYAGSLTVTVDDSTANLNLVASDGGVAYGESDDASFSVSTTSSGGYTATITGGNSTGRLTGTDSNNYFSSIANATASPANFDNGTWGFKPNAYNSTANVVYQPVPTSEDVVTIDQTNSAMTGNYTLAVAAKTDTDTTPDTYSYNFVVSATSNAIDYDVVYTDSSFPARTIGSTNGSTITLSNETPTKDGYTFAGWCTASVSPGSACTGTTYAAGASYTLDSNSANNVTLYAIWEQPTMQTFSCSSLNVGDTTTLVDARDGIEYNIGKYTDNNNNTLCWMLDNLAFNGKDNKGNGSYITMNSDNTHINSSVTWNDTVRTGWTSSSQNVYNASYINDASKNVISSNAKDTAGGWKVGVYYNYCAATVGDICSSSTTTAASYDVCPKGWRLPTGGSSGEFQALYNKSGYNTYDTFRDALHLPLSGNFDSGSKDYQGSYGFWWSSTARNDTGRYGLYVTTSNINPAENNGGRYIGFSVRCVAQ